MDAVLALEAADERAGELESSFQAELDLAAKSMRAQNADAERLDKELQRR